MLPILLALSLTSALTVPASPGIAEPAPESPASSGTLHRRLPSPAIPEEEPESKPAKGAKETAKHAAKEGAKDEAEEPAPAKRPERRAKAPARPVHKPAAPLHAGPSEAETRAAILEAENARLRQQLAAANGVSTAPYPDPLAALQELRSGNQRFVAGARVRTLLSMQDSVLRAQLAKGQSPFAVIITCSDSRLADNLIFDQELGRLFTIREAGNCPDIQGLASVEYAVEHLGSKLVVVLGHGSCGAVKAVSEAHGKPMPGNLWALQAGMAGLLEAVGEDPNEDAATHMGHLVETNARRQAQVVVDRSDMVRERVEKGKLMVVPAVYDLASGQVTFLAPVSAGKEASGHHAGLRPASGGPKAS